jgi:hypothetical protein
MNWWPYLVTAGVLAILLYAKLSGYHRPALPVATTRTHVDAVALAELVRSGTFYVSGTVLDWDLCYEFAIKVLTKDANITP